MSYPLVLLGGIAIGSGILSIQLPQQQASAATTQPPKKPLPVRGRASAESPELRELRAAEAALFPEVGSRDLELSSTEFWDEAQLHARGGETQDKARSLGDSSNDELWSTLRMPALPVRKHARVAKYIEYFTGTARGRKLLTTWLRRSGRYDEIIDQALRDRQLPTELRAVAYIESGFWPTARSSAGAVGLWQFMPQTARAYGLFVDKSVDERRSIWRATDAATQHLSDLYQRFHSWDLALAAYNMGYKQLLARMQEVGVDDYWSLSEIDGALPRETALYVPKVLAIAVILNNLPRFELDDVERMPALSASEIHVPPGVRMSLIARAAGTSLTMLQEMNPEFRGEVVPDRGGPITLHIPSHGLARAKTMLPRLLQEDDGKLDTQVSAEFDWGEQELDQNGNKSRLELTAPKKSADEAEPAEPADKGKAAEPAPTPPGGASSHKLERIKPPASDGNDLLKPTGRLEPRFDHDDSADIAQALMASFKPTMRPVPAAKLKHSVQPGETIWKLSEVYGVPRWRIIYDNGLRHPDVLTIGRKLVLNTPEFNEPLEDGAMAEKVSATGRR